MKSVGILSAVIAATLVFGVASPVAAQDIQERKIKWGTLDPPDNPNNMAVRKFAEILKEKSGGKMIITEYPSSQLGNEMQQQAALRGGTQEMFSAASSFLVGLVKEFALLDVPFNVNTPEQSDALVDGPLGKALIAKLPEKDLIGLEFLELGFRSTTNSRRPINAIEDLKGLKLRVMNNPLHVAAFNALGANPVPMNFGEVYSALETKSIDGQENPLPTIKASLFYEVQKYLSGTNHVFTTPMILVGKKFWDKLSPTEQRLMREAAVITRDYNRQVARQQNRDAVAFMVEKGIQYNEMPQAERDRLREAVAPVVQKFLTTLDPKVVEIYSSELKRIRGQK